MKHSLLRLSILVLLLVLYSSVFAQNFEVDGVNYKITSSSTVEVSSKSPKYSGDVIIPESVNYDGNKYSVTSIGKYAFNGCSSLNSVNIPNSVTSIESCSFYGCI